MKILLVALNAKYIHSCPAVYSLKAAAGSEAGSIRILECTINDRYEDILGRIMAEHADMIGFSVYIWNAELMHPIIRDVRRISSSPLLFAGGPEVSNNYENYIDDLDLIIRGEGETSFAALAKGKCSFHDIPGAIFKENGSIIINHPAAQVELDSLPFLYSDLSDFANRIIYYESSRGCPFGCSYCLSSIDHGLRFRSLELVKKELQYFLDRNVRQVKFIDRTFNCSHGHAKAIWQYIKAHDNGITNFHFEIGADLIDDEELSLLTSMRPGLVQLEAGIQSTNERVLNAVNRVTDMARLKYVINTLHAAGNINLHTDLIAGLPYEDSASFRNSFNEVYIMRAEQLQLGFLKVLPGTEIAARAGEFGIRFSSRAPYEAFSTDWISYYELCQLHDICDMLDIFYNSGQFSRTLPVLEQYFMSPYDMYAALAGFFRAQGYMQNIPSHRKRYEVLGEFAAQCAPEVDINLIHEYLRFDEALHFNRSRRMRETLTFDLGKGPVTCEFHYDRRNPVNGEAVYIT